MKIYTKTGDKGETSIIGGRVSKDDVQVEAYGTVDEANGYIGLAASLLPELEQELKTELEKIQHELFDCGADLSRKTGIKETYPYKVQSEMISFLEERIDEYMQEAPKLERFILPGGTQVASVLHIARTVVRRAERRVVTFANEQPSNAHVQQYLNRLSDYLFALARVLNHRMGCKDVEYERSAKVFRSNDK